MTSLVAAASGIAPDAASRTYFDLARLRSMTHWWHWILLLTICLVLVSWMVYVYRRDSIGLPRGVHHLQ